MWEETRSGANRGECVYYQLPAQRCTAWCHYVRLCPAQIHAGSMFSEHHADGYCWTCITDMERIA